MSAVWKSETWGISKFSDANIERGFCSTDFVLFIRFLLFSTHEFVIRSYHFKFVYRDRFSLVFVTIVVMSYCTVSFNDTHFVVVLILLCEFCIHC